MKLMYLTLFLLALCAQSIIAQKKCTDEYFTKLKTELVGNLTIDDIFIEKEFYKNDQLKKYAFYAKFNTDSIDRYFHVGECFNFHKNGELAYYHKTDVKTLLDIDTSYYYNKRGDIEALFVDVHLKHPDQKLDSSSFLNEKLNLYRTGIYIHEFAFYKDSMKINDLPVYKKLCQNIISVDYKKGVKREFGELSLDLIDSYYKPKGKHYRYRKDGSLKDVIDYDSLNYNRPDFANTAYISNYELDTEGVKYSGASSPETCKYINDALNKLKKKKRKALIFTKGSYTINGDTMKCYIYEDNTASQDYHNTFFISKTEQGYKVLTAKEVDSYSFGEKKYRSICIDGYCYFMKELVKGPISFYERQAVPTDNSKKYYILISNSKEVYALGDVFYHTSGNRYFDCYLENHTHYKGQLLVDNIEIKSFFLSLPNKSNNLTRSIRLTIKFHDLKISNLIKKYNHEQ